MHQAAGIYAERVPLSGAAHYRGNNTDVDVYAFGRDAAPLVCEVKGRKNGGGFKTIEGWLSDADVLFIKQDRQQPLVLLPWRTWERLARAAAKLPPLAPPAELLAKVIAQ